MHAERALWESEERYRRLFEAAPISLWEEDWSAVKGFVEDLQRDADEDFSAVIERQPEVLARAAEKVRVLAVNEATLKLYGAESEDQLLATYETQAKTTPRHGFKQRLLGLIGGHFRVTAECDDVRQNGDRFQIRVTHEILKEHREDWKRVLAAVEDITEAIALSRQLEHQATHDSLTGLVNRREFGIRLQRLLRRMDREQVEHAVCYLDLDQFKVINDTCGHAAGDELLCNLGTVLAQQIRSRDTLARLGGDEFGVLLEHCPLPQAMGVARALRNATNDFRFVWRGQSFRSAVSIGLVPIRGNRSTVTQALSAADAACYAAKDKGRNRIQVYHEKDVELARRHGEMQWVTRIQRALEEDRFTLARQPIVPVLSSGAVAGMRYELLLRMRDEDDQLILPSAFLAAAERYNLSTKIDQWVVQTAFRLLEREREELARLLLCSINLSGLSLLDEEFLHFVLSKFAAGEVPPEKICFEVTETAAITNVSGAISFIQELRKLGCHFALDDFGSGLSSFAYLKNLPVDFLKIDGAFVRDIVDNTIDRAMVKSINEIGHVMGKQTIAEFVENQAIFEVLKEIGVDFVQGFATGQPEILGPV